jgi:hypothetical protein
MNFWDLNEHIADASFPTRVGKVEDKAKGNVGDKNEDISDAEVTSVVLLVFVVLHWKKVYLRVGDTNVHKVQTAEWTKYAIDKTPGRAAVPVALNWDT